MKLFRQIRQNLLAENGTRKYLLYAFGEIFLVMIGILLALQVNNWNENRIQKIREIKLASQLMEDAIADSTFFQSRIEFYQVRDTLLKNLLSLQGENLNDSISQIKLNDNDPFFFRLAYQSNLINNNPDAYDHIYDPEIKNKLRLYKAKYDYVVHSIELSNRMTENYGTPLKLKFYDQLIKMNESTIIGDFTTIINTDDTMAIIDLLREYGHNFYRQLENFMTVNQQLRKLLEDYISKNK